MKYPELVPDKICTVLVIVYRTDGINRDGTPKQVTIFEGRCFHAEKPKQRITADKQIITLSGEVLFNGDIAPDTDVITGEVVLGTGIRRTIYASQKCRNLDGSVNYTRLELM